MESLFLLQFYSSGRDMFRGKCKGLIIPSEDGMYGFEANHSPAIASIVPGTLKLTDEKGQEFYYAVSEGILKFENNTALILVDTAERADEIDVAKAQHSIAEAEEELHRKRSGQDIELAKKKLVRELNRINVKKHYS